MKHIGNILDTIVPKYKSKIVDIADKVITINSIYIKGRLHNTFEVDGNLTRNKPTMIDYSEILKLNNELLEEINIDINSK